MVEDIQSDGVQQQPKEEEEKRRRDFMRTNQKESNNIVKINRNLFRLKELLGLVIRKGGDAPAAQDASIDSGASFSIHRVEGTNIKMEAANQSKEASFDLMNSSFKHSPVGN